ncbi:hypothetical protein NNJEOMEG_02266 [Fundidesulfovibrio magnetotacticus]|uniref:Phage tail assembly chaperone protein, E, or 41 or 14 n=1 Tax=Fundidesulfovibrio magnetotacticus TaxID=2730080 RepID=A0A6V8LV11_9BACT|nr:phage tail assembly protein [Fundidesulfovibrio magnetotacticus]GFK94421.1 hypothetical protein NNJEOMEG_02266 [Fundidesulfovibrio magnetotacticus]
MSGTTVTGTLKYGHVDAEGVRHAEFEMRAPTLGDMEWAVEQAPDGACPAKLARFIWSRALVRLGSLPPEKITPELLEGLHYAEYSVLDDAEKELAGKLAPASAS